VRGVRSVSPKWENCSLHKITQSIPNLVDKLNNKRKSKVPTNRIDTALAFLHLPPNFHAPVLCLFIFQSIPFLCSNNE